MSADKSSQCCFSFNGCAKTTTHSLPANPYFVFLAEFRKNLKSRSICNFKPTSVAKIAGRKWREMTPAQKKVYIETAKTNRSKVKTTRREACRLLKLICENI